MELTIRAVFRKYLDWYQKHRSPRTAQWYDEHLARFLVHLSDLADLPLASLKPYHVVEWVDSHETWGDTFKRGGIVAVQRACNWAEAMGYIDATPLKRIVKPPARRRDNPMAPEDFQAILARIEEGDPFRDLFLFIWHTPAVGRKRPGTSSRGTWIRSEPWSSSPRKKPRGSDTHASSTCTDWLLRSFAG